MQSRCANARKTDLPSGGPLSPGISGESNRVKNGVLRQISARSGIQFPSALSILYLRVPSIGDAIQESDVHVTVEVSARKSNGK